LARLLDEAPRMRCRWLVTRSDEYTLPVTQPLTRGADRVALLAHQRRQLQLESPYHTSLSLQRRPQPRPEEDILLCGLADAASLAPWLEIFTSRPARLLGIHTPALLSPALAPRLPGSGHFRILIQPEQARLRLTCLGPEGALRFSRSTPHTAPLEAAGGELIQLLRYLRSQKMLGAQETPRLILISTDNGAEAMLTPQLAALPDTPLSCMSPIQLAAQGAPHAHAQTHVLPLDRLFHQLAFESRQAADLRPEPLRQAHRQRQLGLILGGGAGLLLTTCLAYAGQSYWTHLELEDELARMRQQTRTLEQETQTRLSQLPGPPLAAAQITRLQALEQRLAARQHGPRALLEQLAQTLAQHPELQLQQLDWHWPPLTAEPPSTPGTPDRLQLQLELSPAEAADVQAIDQLATRLGAWPGATAPRVELGHPPNDDSLPRWRISLDLEAIPHAKP
jgi:hypothetical protein